MDPLACFALLSAALLSGDRDAVTEHAGALAEWLHNDGAPPCPEGWVDDYLTRAPDEPYLAFEARLLAQECGRLSADPASWDKRRYLVNNLRWIADPGNEYA